MKLTKKVLKYISPFVAAAVIGGCTGSLGGTTSPKIGEGLNLV